MQFVKFQLLKQPINLGVEETFYYAGIEKHKVKKNIRLKLVRFQLGHFCQSEWRTKYIVQSFSTMLKMTSYRKL